MAPHDASFGFESGSYRLSGTPFPWFDRESYPRVLAIMVDRDLMPPTYDWWLRQSQRVLEKARREGQRPIRAHIDPQQFLDWCNDNNMLPDSVARLAYAAFVAGRMFLHTEAGESMPASAAPGLDGSAEPSHS
jgi:hypothetical protein